jgi:hypothetical protein
MSKVSCAPRCTAPMPPVTKTSMLAIAAHIIVPATVVAPSPPPASTAGRSRRLTLCTWSERPSSSSSSRNADVDSPTDQRDSRGLGSHSADQGLHFARSANIFRVGHAVGDDGRFQRHERTAGRLCSSYRGAAGQPGVCEVGNHVDASGGGFTEVCSTRLVHGSLCKRRASLPPACCRRSVPADTVCARVETTHMEISRGQCMHCQCAHHLLPKLPNRMKSGPLIWAGQFDRDKRN